MSRWLAGRATAAGPANRRRVDPARARMPRALAALLCLILLGAAACDVPTRPPAWDTRWVVAEWSLVLPIDSMPAERVALSPDRDAVRAETVVDGLRIASGSTELELQGVDATVRDAIRGAALPLTIENPVAVRGRVDLHLTTGGTEISESVTLEPGTTRQRVEFTGPEARALLGGGTATLTIETVVVATEGTASVRPPQRIVLESRLELVIGMRP